MRTVGDFFTPFPRVMRRLVSGLVALTMTVVVSLASFTLPNVKAAGEADPGMMVVMGKVEVDGNPAKMGATFYSGSTVTTGEDGVVIIELGKLGRATIGPVTTAVVTYSAAELLITTTCDDMRVSVREGECTIRNVKSGESKVMPSVKDEHFDSNVEVRAAPFIDVVVNCGRDVVCPAPYVIPEPTRLWPFFLLLGGVGLVLGGTVSLDPKPGDIIRTNDPDPRLSDARPPG